MVWGTSIQTQVLAHLSGRDAAAHLAWLCTLQNQTGLPVSGCRLMGGCACSIACSLRRVRRAASATGEAERDGARGCISRTADPPTFTTNKFSSSLNAP